MSNAATPKPGRFEEEWKKSNLAPTVMRGTADLREATLIVMSVKPELAMSWKLLVRTALSPCGCEENTINLGEQEDKSAGRLVVPKFPDEMRNEEQGPSSSSTNQKRGDKEGEERRSEEPMQQDPDRAGKDNDKASTGGVPSLDFNFLDNHEIRTETLQGTTEPAEDETSTLEPPPAFMNISRNLAESSSAGKSKTIETKLLTESPRRRRIEGSARVPFLGTLPEEEWEVHHRDHEIRTGCNIDRVAFMEEVWTVVQCYGT